MNYYIKGDAAKAQQIKAAFERLGYDTRNLDYSCGLFITFNNDRYVHFLYTDSQFVDIIKTHSDYTELPLSVEPKFKVHDWVVDGDRVAIIYDLQKNGYAGHDVNRRDFVCRYSDESRLHLWSIQDAKDGDVLATDNGWACIFKAFDGWTFSSYCFMDSQNWFCEFGSEVHTPDSKINGNIHPATKEQRDLLFKKMREAGYQWNPGKKELRKIIEPKFNVLDWIIRNDGSSVVPIQVYGLKKDRYLVTNMLGSKGQVMTNRQDEWRLWTIQDAKDGDVLVCYSEVKGGPIEQAGIFKQYVGRHGGCSNTFLAHTGIDWDGNIIINGYMGSTNILPATKEQCDLMFTRIREAGYEWNSDKKELRKIIKPNFKVGDWIVRGEGFVYEPSLITEIRDYYICELLNGERVTYTLNDVHKNFHLWKIEDAKDGDVLSVDFNGFQKIVIFKSLSDKGVEGYGITAFKDSVDFPTSYGKEYYSKTWTETLTPATKEQRCRLFTELEKAGYKWDAEKKELRKIQHYDIANFQPFNEVLVRDGDLGLWKCDIFSSYDDNFYCFRGTWEQCIPYEDNKHLLGTTDPCDEFYINW